MAGITVACSHCGAQLKLKDDSKVGKSAPCPKCSQTFVIQPVEEAAGDFDFGDEDFGDEEEAPSPKKKGKGASSKKGGKSDKGKKSKKGKKSSGSNLPLMIGGGVLVLLLVVGGVLWATGVLGGGDAADPVVADNSSTPGTTTPDSGMTPAAPAGNAAANSGEMSPEAAMSHAESSSAPTGPNGHASSVPGTPGASAAHAGPAGMSSSLPPPAAPASHAGAPGMSSSLPPPGAPASHAGMSPPTGSLPPPGGPGAAHAGMSPPMGSLPPPGGPGAAHADPAAAMQASIQGYNPPGVPQEFAPPKREPLAPLTSLNVTPGEFTVPRLDTLLPKTDAFVHLQVQHLLASGTTLKLINLLRQQGTDPLDEFQKEVGVPLTDVESVTVAFADLAETSKKNEEFLKQFQNRGNAQAGGSFPGTNPGPGAGGDSGFIEADPASTPQMANPGMMAGGIQPPPSAPTLIIVQFKQGVDVEQLKPYQEGQDKGEGASQYRLFKVKEPPAGMPQFGPPPKPMAAKKLDTNILVVADEKILAEVLQKAQPWSPELQTRFAGSDFKHHLALFTDFTRLKDVRPPEAGAGAEEMQRLNQLLLKHTTQTSFSLDLIRGIQISAGIGTDTPEGAKDIAEEIKSLRDQAGFMLLVLQPKFPDLVQAVKGVLEATEVSAAENQVTTNINLSEQQVETLSMEGQKAVGGMMQMAMTGALKGPPENIGTDIIRRGVEPTEQEGLPEGWSMKAQVGWYAATTPTREGQPQRDPTLEPVVEVVLYDGDANKVAAYKATEGIPERNKNAPKAADIVVDRLATGEQPPRGILTKFYPRSTADIILPAFEGTLLLRVPKKVEEVIIPKAGEVNGAADHPTARQLGMQVGKSDQGSSLRLLYKPKSTVVINSIEVVDAQGNPLPGNPTTEHQKDTTYMVFNGQYPPDAGFKFVFSSELETVKVSFKFTDLPIPLKPNDARAFEAEDRAKRYPPSANPNQQFGGEYPGGGFPGSPGYPGSSYTPPGS